MRAPLSRRNVLLLLGSAVVGLTLLQLSRGSIELATGTASAAVADRHAGPHLPKAPRRLAAPEARTLFAAARRTADASKASELFASRTWYTPPPPPPPPPPAAVEAPTAPPLPFRFLGAYSDAGGPTVYFITRDDRVYDVKPGDTLDQTYTVDAIRDGQLVFTYKPLNVQQLLPLGDGS